MDIESARRAQFHLQQPTRAFLCWNDPKFNEWWNFHIVTHSFKSEGQCTAGTSFFSRQPSINISFWFCKSKLDQRETKNLYHSIVSQGSVSVLWVKPLMPGGDFNDLFLTLKLLIAEPWFPPSTSTFVSETEQQKTALVCLMACTKKDSLPPFLQLVFNIYLSLSTFSCL